jgi:hypothetical protein
MKGGPCGITLDLEYVDPASEQRLLMQPGCHPTAYIYLLAAEGSWGSTPSPGWELSYVVIVY